MFCKLAMVGAMTLVVELQLCGVTRGETVWADSANSYATFKQDVPDPVVEFLNRSPFPADLNHSPRQVVERQDVTIPSQVESQTVPLPPGVWTGMSGLLGLGIFSAARNARRKMR